MGRANARVELRSAFLGGVFAALLMSAAPAIADVGDALLAGRFNTVDKKTTISGSAAGDSMFKVANRAADGTGIRVQVEPGNPPFVVDSAKRVKRLNADKLDGYHAEEFALAGTETLAAHGHIRGDGSIRNSSDNVTSVTKPDTGQYCIQFADSIPQQRLEDAVVGLAGGGTTVLFARMTNGQQPFTCPVGNLVVQVTDINGDLADGRFSFIVP